MRCNDITVDSSEKLQFFTIYHADVSKVLSVQQSTNVTTLITNAKCVETRNKISVNEEQAQRKQDALVREFYPKGPCCRSI